MASTMDLLIYTSLCQNNLDLFGADPSSTEWKAYVDYIDDMVLDGFFMSIDCSLRFFLENTGRICWSSPRIISFVSDPTLNNSDFLGDF